MRNRLTLCLAAVAVIAARSSRAEPASPAWLERLNFYRASAALPPVAEAPALSAGVEQHARYMVKHDVISHFEKPRRSWATREGDEAGRVSNLAASKSSTEPDTWAVDTWMQAPFHAVGILDPTLQLVGFGIHREGGGRIRTAAALDVIHGRTASPPASISYPIVWPSDGATVPLTDGIGEYPNPLSGCKGYKAPTGLPLIVQLGSGELVPHLVRSSLTSGGHRLEHCIFDESTYRNRKRTQQELGRRILAARDAIVLIPKKPLVRGSRYDASVEVDGRRIEWSFSIGKDFTTEITEGSAFSVTSVVK